MKVWTDKPRSNKPEVGKRTLSLSECFEINIASFDLAFLVDVGDEEVWYSLAVLLPILALLDSTTLHISRATVSDHSGEEDDVEEGQEVIQATAETPRQCHDRIRSVVNLNISSVE